MTQLEQTPVNRSDRNANCDKNVIANAKLSICTKETETQNIGTKYQHYILMEYHCCEYSLMNQLKQNEILSTQDAADKALAEPEAEINKRKIRTCVVTSNPELFLRQQQFV